MPGELLDMIESDLADTLASKSEFASAITLISPDGLSYTGFGRVTDDYTKAGENGELVVVEEPCIIIRKSDWARLPKAGEKWFISSSRLPILAPGKAWMLNDTQAPERANTIGFIRLFPKAVSQS